MPDVPEDAPPDRLPRPEEPDTSWPQVRSAERVLRRQSPGSRRAITALRIAIYLVPGPFSLTAFAVAGTYLGDSISVWVAVTVAALVLVVALGIFDGLLASTVAKQDHRPAPRALAMHVLTFLFLQVMFGPLIALAALLVAVVVHSIF